MYTGVLISIVLASSVAFAAGGEDEFDQVAVKQKQLRVAINTKNELSDEIANLEKVSAERARHIKSLDVQLKAARQELAEQQAVTEQARARAAVLQKTEAELAAEVAKVSEQLALHEAANLKSDEEERAELKKIDEQRAAEMKKKAQLTAQISKLKTRKQKHVDKKRVANEQVDELYRVNARLYDKIKGRLPAVQVVAETPE